MALIRLSSSSLRAEANGEGLRRIGEETEAEVRTGGDALSGAAKQMIHAWGGGQ